MAGRTDGSSDVFTVVVMKPQSWQTTAISAMLLLYCEAGIAQFCYLPSIRR